MTRTRLVQLTATITCGSISTTLFASGTMLPSFNQVRVSSVSPKCALWRRDADLEQQVQASAGTERPCISVDELLRLLVMLTKL